MAERRAARLRVPVFASRAQECAARNAYIQSSFNNTIVTITDPTETC